MSLEKIKKAFSQKKQKTAQELDQEYQNQALNAGHKAALAQKLLNEVEQHHTRMHAISKEATKQPKPTAPQTTPAAATTTTETAKT